MDKVIFDFENETMEMTTDSGSFREHIKGLAMNREKILAAAGVAVLDLDEMKGLMEQLRAGEIDEQEFLEKCVTAAIDAMKSRFHETLN